jgi:hypothetical protein
MCFYCLLCCGIMLIFRSRENSTTILSTLHFPVTLLSAYTADSSLQIGQTVKNTFKSNRISNQLLWNTLPLTIGYHLSPGFACNLLTHYYMVFVTRSLYQEELPCAGLFFLSKTEDLSLQLPLFRNLIKGSAKQAVVHSQKFSLRKSDLRWGITNILVK